MLIDRSEILSETWSTVSGAVLPIIVFQLEISNLINPYIEVISCLSVCSVDSSRYGHANQQQ